MITFPPQMRDGSPDAMVYRHIAGQQSKILRDQLALGKLNMGTRRVTLNNGVEITCTYCYGKEDIWVKIPPVVVEESGYIVSVSTGVIFHPRSGQVRLGPTHYHTTEFDWEGYPSYPAVKVFGIDGGWVYGRNKTTLDESGIFPISDTDHMSFLVGFTTTNKVCNGNTQTSVSAYAGFPSNEAYGNIAWTNRATYSESGGWDKPYSVVSYKGFSTRHFRINPVIDIGAGAGNIIGTGSVTTISYVEIPTLSTAESTYESGGFFDDRYYTLIFTQLGRYYYIGGTAYPAPMFTWPSWNGSASPVAQTCLVLGASDAYMILLTNPLGCPEVYAQLSNGECLDEANVAARLATLNGATPKPNPPIVQTGAWKRPASDQILYSFWTNKLSTDNVGNLTVGPIRSRGWELVGTVMGNRAGLPWFGNSAGNKFVCDDGQEVVFTTVENGKARSTTVTRTYQQYSQGSYKEDIAHGSTLFEINHPKSPWYFEYNGEEIQSAEVSFYLRATTAGTNQKIDARHELTIGASVIPVCTIKRDFDIGTWGVREDYEITSSVLYYLDTSETVCLYKTVKEYLKFNVPSDGPVAIMREPWQNGAYHQMKVKTDNYEAKRVTTWNLLIRDTTQVLHTREDGIDPFPDGWEPYTIPPTSFENYMTNGYYVTEGGTLNPNPAFVPDYTVRQVFLYPQPPSKALPLSDEIKCYGFYDYGHDPFAEMMSELNYYDGGGKDYFWPRYLREGMLQPPNMPQTMLKPDASLTGAQINPTTVMQYLAVTRTYVLWFHEETGVENNGWPYLPIQEHPYPCGNFVAHPVAGDVWQFCVDGGASGGLVFTSPTIAAGGDTTAGGDGGDGTVQEKLNQWFRDNPHVEKIGYRNSGVTVTEHTHDTTLYYPIGII